MGIKRKVQKVLGLSKTNSRRGNTGLTTVTETETNEEGAGSQAVGAVGSQAVGSQSVGSQAAESREPAPDETQSSSDSSSEGDEEPPRRRSPSDIVEMDSDYESQQAEPQRPFTVTKGDQIEQICTVVISKALRSQRRMNAKKGAKSARDKNKENTLKKSQQPQKRDDSSTSDEIEVPLKEILAQSGIADSDIIPSNTMISAISAHSSATDFVENEPRDEAFIKEIRYYVRKVHSAILEAVENESDDASTTDASISSRHSLLKLYHGFERTDLACHPTEEEGFEISIEKQFKHIPPRMRHLIHRMVVTAILSKREQLLAATKYEARPIENRGPDPIEEAMREIEFLPEEPM